ncbi:MAG: signal peptidase II [Bacteriovorax sp.]|nr:signal peptidase II [Bacteriovorax sp.]
MKKDIFFSLLVFALCVGIDMVLKYRFLTSVDSHINRGFIFGSLQDLPQSLTLVTLTSFGGVLFFIYLLLITLLSRELITLKIGLGMLIGGVLGNVVDRALHAGTLDFIPFVFNHKVVMVFNPADLFQWVGTALIVLTIFLKEKIIWYPDNQRGFGLINPKEQIKFALKFSFISLSTCLVLGIFSISYLSLTLKESQNPNQSTIIAFGVSFLAITVFFNILSFIAGIVLSKRTAGPLYAFEKYVEALLAGERKELKLREGDNYKHLEEVAANLRNHLNT